MKSIEARGNDTTIYGTKVSQLPYMAQTCPQNILSVTFQNQSSVRHNIPQASNETFSSRGTEIRQLIGSSIRWSYPLIIHDCHQIVIVRAV